MISNNQKKLLHLLSQKKHREKHGLFILEGDKLVRDALEQNQVNPVKVNQVWGTENWVSSIPGVYNIPGTTLHIAEEDELKKLSSLVTPPGVIATARLPVYPYEPALLKEKITLVLDAIRDPGNMGTIIRTADWFGFNTIICSPDCVDAFNSKVVQASMGAILRIKIIYHPVEKVLRDARQLNVQAIGTTLDGHDFFDAKIQKPSLVVFGNESKGISKQLADELDMKILISAHGGQISGSESLNVASTVAIVCSELRRRGL